MVEAVHRDHSHGFGHLWPHCHDSVTRRGWCGEGGSGAPDDSIVVQAMTACAYAEDGYEKVFQSC